MSSIPSAVPPPGSENPGVGAPSGPGFNISAMYASLIGQADALGTIIDGYYSQISGQNLEMSKLDNALVALNNLAGDCNGKNGIVNTSSIKAELKTYGIDVPNPANATQIGDAISSAHDILSTLGSQNSVSMDKMQMEMGEYNTAIDQLSSTCEALTQTSQSIAKAMA